MRINGGRADECRDAWRTAVGPSTMGWAECMIRRYPSACIATKGGAASGAQRSAERSTRPYPVAQANGRSGRLANGGCFFFHYVFSLATATTTTTTNQTIDSVWMCVCVRAPVRLRLCVCAFVRVCVCDVYFECACVRKRYSTLRIYEYIRLFIFRIIYMYTYLRPAHKTRKHIYTYIKYVFITYNMYTYALSTL